MAPLPNSSGCLEIRFSTEYDVKRGQDVAAAGQHAEGGAQRGAPQRPGIRIRRKSSSVSHRFSTFLVTMLRVDPVLEVADDLGHAEQADGQRHEVQAAVELADART